MLLGEVKCGNRVPAGAIHERPDVGRFPGGVFLDKVENRPLDCFGLDVAVEELRAATEALSMFLNPEYKDGAILGERAHAAESRGSVLQAMCREGDVSLGDRDETAFEICVGEEFGSHIEFGSVISLVPI